MIFTSIIALKAQPVTVDASELPNNSSFLGDMFCTNKAFHKMSNVRNYRLDNFQSSGNTKVLALTAGFQGENCSSSAPKVVQSSEGAKTFTSSVNVTKAFGVEADLAKIFLKFKCEWGHEVGTAVTSEVRINSYSVTIAPCYKAKGSKSAYVYHKRGSVISSYFSDYTIVGREVMVIGNTGAIYYETETCPHKDNTKKGLGCGTRTSPGDFLDYSDSFLDDKINYEYNNPC